MLIRVEVARGGAVNKAEIDQAGTNTSDECLLENAMASARSARFTSSSSAPDPQRGTITYRFVAQ